MEELRLGFHDKIVLINERKILRNSTIHKILEQCSLSLSSQFGFRACIQGLNTLDFVFPVASMFFELIVTVYQGLNTLDFVSPVTVYHLHFVSPVLS
jgi:hypothetical protein